MSKNAVMINGQRYPSARDAAKALHYSYSVLMHQLKSDHYPNHIILKNKISYVIDGVDYESLEVAASKLDLSVYKVKQRLMELGNGEVVTDLPVEDQKKKPRLLKPGSKPVSINGVCFPTVSAARFYNSRYGDQASERGTMLRRLNSDDPKWANWVFVSEADLPERLPDHITSHYFPREIITVNCFLHEYAFMVMRYMDPVQGECFKMIPGVTVDDTPKKGEQTMSFKLLDDTYLNIESDKLPPQGGIDYFYIKNELKRYLDIKQAK